MSDCINMKVMVAFVMDSSTHGSIFAVQSNLFAP